MRHPKTYSPVHIWLHILISGIFLLAYHNIYRLDRGPLPTKKFIFQVIQAEDILSSSKPNYKKAYRLLEGAAEINNTKAQELIAGIALELLLYKGGFVEQKIATKQKARAIKMKSLTYLYLRSYVDGGAHCSEHH